MFNVVIVDDHSVVREGIKHIIENNEGYIVSAEVKSGYELLTLIKTHKADIIILDISLPDKNGLEILRQLKQEKPHIRVLVLSMHSEEQYALRAYKLGAEGYLTKSSTSQELIKAMTTIQSGKKYITESLAENLINQITNDAKGPPHENLSNREYEVMRMLASGKKLCEIADTLNLSVQSISTYKTRVLKKMNLHNNAELTRYAIDYKLI
jgi:two-component system, NarL family, invasion response regulator UvrY